ncbi:MAG TPA: GDSL-type esterase/lipase family protein [Syntrophales bacterium]|nr:GDSL-type esterase/lipase family protein [Syntrophales bacterium]HNS53461.1 GDSL-type esterase/lipase family protein [Syntrophales bacterium]HQL90567.1 GDSL-type esterase/lipase family protein [Syntrophales bacterium]
MKRPIRFIIPVLVVVLLAPGVPQAAADTAAPLCPKRLSSTGDSMTEAIDAELPAANHWASWVNGYHGFWEWLLGLTNVYSHNQRITKIYGSSGRANYMEAKSGADMFDFAAQAAQAVSRQAHYVTVLMGHNDACQDRFIDIPSNAVFEDKFREGMDILKAGLPKGATVYVVGIVDIYRLWEVAQDKKALGIVDCEVLWATTLLKWYPCSTMLNPLIGEAGRQYTKARIQGFNAILKAVTEGYNAADPNHRYVYTPAAFEYKFGERHVSDIDCFHPSAYGQKTLSEMTWNPALFTGCTK